MIPSKPTNLVVTEPLLDQVLRILQTCDECRPKVGQGLSEAKDRFEFHPCPACCQAIKLLVH